MKLRSLIYSPGYVSDADMSYCELGNRFMYGDQNKTKTNTTDILILYTKYNNVIRFILNVLLSTNKGCMSHKRTLDDSNYRVTTANVI